ncbi:hypothetical protein P1J78_02250 [Psychromarinibacter sp. C21-152]|uniref:Holin-X, holin superfamily III n=1 Tax=Psychromarinibacter sediminicola TaxID=3033385 RepID=A0AAE3T6R4_9RHOB|nr:hypothetical protein [Psychromarinibacter sediminicola]MDF0599542.1 hypothetical protein [Psychromarinibacter sediminicola]
MWATLEYRIALILRSAALRLFFAVVAAGLLLAGLAFLGIALWVVLEARGGTAFAAGWIGGGCLVLGFLTLGLGVAYRPRPPAAPPLSLADLVAAFVSGYGAAQATKKTGDDE